MNQTFNQQSLHMDNFREHLVEWLLFLKRLVMHIIISFESGVGLIEILFC